MNHISARKIEHDLQSLGTHWPVDLQALRSYRYARVQQLLCANDCAAAILYNPINIRYATDSRNMTVWMLHNMGRYCVVPAQGRAILFEYANQNCLLRPPALPAIAEVRMGVIHAFFDAGAHAEAVSRRWASGIVDVVRSTMGAGTQRIAVDRVDIVGAAALREQGFILVEGQRIMELARSIKSRDEINCMRHSLAVADCGMQRMREALAPGITETALWAELHHANITHGGEWIETRLLSSGPRTNPWFQEASDRVIEAGELVSFDTDMVGPYGYCADVSRTFLCGDRQATGAQRSLYALAVEQVEHNTALIRPGLEFRDYTRQAWQIPPRFLAQNYGCVAHGVGMVDEWPSIFCDPDDPTLYDDVLQPGMTVCVESYVGEVGGVQGVKFEQQVLVTDTGHEVLSDFPLEPRLS